jgi:hypothetical protein
MVKWLQSGVVFCPGIVGDYLSERCLEMGGHFRRSVCMVILWANRCLRSINGLTVVF